MHIAFRAAPAVSILTLVPIWGQADVFEVSVTAGGVTEQASFRSAEDAIDRFEDDDLESINAAYSDGAPADARINFRGSEILASYPNDGSGLQIDIPSIGFSRTFDEGDNREDNQQAFVDFLEDNEDDILQRFLKSLAAETAIDPVAGNPSSLMSRMVAQSFAMGTPVGDRSILSPTRSGEGENIFGYGLEYGRFDADGTDVDTLTLPLSYSVGLQRFGASLKFDLPLTVTDTDGAQTYAAAVGVGLALPVTDAWTITPAARIGAAGSIDLGAAGVLAGASLTSNYTLQIGATAIDIANGVTYLETLPIDAGETEIDYDLQNTALRNGVRMSRPLGSSVMGRALDYEVGVVNTQFFGDDLFVENQTEINVAVGTADVAGPFTNSLKVGVSYTFTDSDYEGFGVNAIYRF